MKDENRRMKRNRDLKVRIREFALRIIRLYSALLKTTDAQVLGMQLLNSGISVGVHYREAQRAKSNADFISKVEGPCKNWKKTNTG